MSNIYRLIVLGKTGMYTYGDLAASPALAKLQPGHLIRGDNQLGIIEIHKTQYRDSRNRLCTHYDNVLIEAETIPGEWSIG